MKKAITLICVAILTAFILSAQTPEAFKYQAVARDNTGEVLANTDVSFKISILQESSGGTSVYTETHDTTTNEFGFVGLEIGNGAVVSGVFADIDWGVDDYFLQIEMDETGGLNYQLMGTSQLLSVPFSLYSKSSGNAGGGDPSYASSESSPPSAVFVDDNGHIGMGTVNPDASAILDVKSTNSGLLLPRLNTFQVSNIKNPAAGLMVFNTDSSDFYGFNGNMWISVWNSGDTIVPFICGTSTIADGDGNTYNTILIGTQCWMNENLKTATYHNGTPIPNVTDSSAWTNLITGAYVWYDNDISWKESYGALYNWYATVDTNGLCPKGWHVPTNDEWTALTDFIGGTDPPYGNQLKSCRQVNSPLGGSCNTTEHPRWSESITNYGTDNYGLSCLPGGNRNNGAFANIGNIGRWWSSTDYASYGAWFRGLSYGTGSFYELGNFKQRGYSVRCLSDY